MNRFAPITTGSWGRVMPHWDRGIPLADWLLRVVDGGLIGIVFVAPYFFGGRHDLGRLVFVALVALIAGAWFARQALLPAGRWPRTSAYFVLLVAAAWLVVQLLPLPYEWIARCSPALVELLPLWTQGGHGTATLGTWHTLSIIPHETAKSLAMMLSYGLLFMVVVGRIQCAADAQRLLRWVAMAAVLMAGFGLLQYFTSDGRFFWFYSHAYRSSTYTVNGAFINRNHFAQFLVLGLGPLVAWRMQVADRPRSLAMNRLASPTAGQRLVAWGTAAAIVVVVIAILGSRSRGGALAMLAASAVLIAVCLIRRLIDSRFLYGVISLAVVVIGLLSVHGYDQVVGRLDDFTEGSLESVDHDGIRRKIWSANVSAIQEFSFTGVGAGGHRDICPVYLAGPFTKEYTHADNSYLQIATETGVLGVTLLACAAGFFVAWASSCLRHASEPAEVRMFGAAAAGLCASFVHSVVDFVWYVPACMSVTVVLGACLLRLAQLTREPGAKTAGTRLLPRGRWVELTAASILVGGWAVHTFFGPGLAAVAWERYLRASVVDSRLSQQAMARFVAGEGVAHQSDRHALSQTMLRHLEAALYWDPNCARVHNRLADRYMAEFEHRVAAGENVLDVTQIRDAALDSRFESVEELHAWLGKAFGPDVKLLLKALAHAHRALELCPMQGDAYLHLADLSFLELSPRAAMQAYIDQGLRVRPNDRNVLTTAGRQSLLAGRIEDSIRLWSRCFNTPGRHQQEIIYRLVASGMPASEFLTSFRPDWQTLRPIWTQYREFGSPADWDELLAYAVSDSDGNSPTIGGKPLVHIWFGRSVLYRDVGRHEESLACLERAYACEPRQYFVRRDLAKALQAAGRHAEAEPHVRWCLARRPADKSLSAALVAITKARLAERGSVGPRERRSTIQAPSQNASSGAAPLSR